ncbi:TPA: pyocin immunity protein [Serratia rubidaea]|nr:pyocin immunity protein [Serratia rubidaea]HDJ1446721.1 pyocin immunity protein [Serratia rubidaea]HDJ1464163.1 pyocin immunity protein [Serratia rubidaea]HDJ2774628.1 pyocin immunity protein [Serratia rubidaea]
MTVNVNALINSIGKTYQELFDEGLIPYKTKPTGFSGDPDLSLNMAKEGVYLSFLRDGYIFHEITLNILRPEIKNWHFPNELPFGLRSEMSKSLVRALFGEPIKVAEPRVVMRRAFGWIEVYEIKKLPASTVMRIDYDLDNNVKDVTFLPIANLRW